MSTTPPLYNFFTPSISIGCFFSLKGFSGSPSIRLASPFFLAANCLEDFFLISLISSALPSPVDLGINFNLATSVAPIPNNNKFSARFFLLVIPFNLDTTLGPYFFPKLVASFVPRLIVKGFIKAILFIPSFCSHSRFNLL